MTKTYRTNCSELRARNACDAGLAFAEAIAAPDGTVTLQRFRFERAASRNYESTRSRFCANTSVQTCGTGRRAMNATSS